MEIDNILLDVIKSQQRTETTVNEMSNRLFGTAGQPGALMIMHQENKERILEMHQENQAEQDKLATRISSVEKKVWYATGFGAAIGAIAGFLGFKIHG